MRFLARLIEGLEDTIHGKEMEKEAYKELKERYKFCWHVDKNHPFDILAVDEEGVMFFEVKSGKARLSERERELKNFIDSIPSGSGRAPSISYVIIRKPGLRDRIKKFFKQIGFFRKSYLSNKRKIRKS